MDDALNNLLVELEKLDIQLRTEEGKLRFNAPQNALTPALREKLQAHKTEVINFLTAQQKRAGHSYTFEPSFAQKHFGLLQKCNPKNCFYNVLSCFQLKGAVDISVLTKSFNAIIARHDSLRTTLQEINGELMQVISPAAEINMQVVKLSDASQKNIDEQLKLEWHTPFDLATESSLRVRLLCLSANEFVLIICTHNVLFEGGALKVLLHELGTHYSSFVKNKPCPLPALPMQYADYVRWQQAVVSSNVANRLDYWRDWFKAGEPLFPTLAKHKTPPVDFVGDTVWLEVPAELTLQLKTLCQQSGITLFSALLTAYAVVLHKYSGYDDITIGTPFANRNHWKIEPLIGSMLVLVSLRFDLSGNPSLSDLLRKVHQTVVSAFSYQDVPFSVISPQLFGQQGITPLFRTVFTFFAESPYDQLQLPDIQVKYIDDVHSDVMRPDLYPGMWEKNTPDGIVLKGYWQYKKSLFSKQQAQEMKNLFLSSLKTMIVQPQQKLSDL